MPKHKTRAHATTQTGRTDRHFRYAPLWLFAFFFGVYLANGDFLLVNDATPNLYTAVSVAREGNVTFTPEEYPFMFIWRIDTPGGVAHRIFPPWDTDYDGTPIRDLYRNGTAHVENGIYMAVKSVREGEYVNFFGLGTGLSALPVIGPLTLAFGDWHDHQRLLWHLGKGVAAAYTAGAASLIFLIASSMTRRRYALAVALAYGLGTCAWSTSSQGILQHAPNEFFLALGTFFLTRIDRGRCYAVFCAAAYAWAVWCRPTSAIVVVCVATYLAWKDRRALMPFLAAGVPLALLLAAYNSYYLGAPLRFGQTVGGALLAEIKTGSPEVWQTPLLEGLAGHLVSPSRGLFVFSPFLLFALWGAVRAWRKEEFALLRPLSAAALLVLLVESKHFDWWSGLSYGYRHIVDMMPFAVLLLVPVAHTIHTRTTLRTIFGVLLVWSIGVQFLGAVAYDTSGWNQRVVTRLRVPGEVETIAMADRAEVERLKATPGVIALGEEKQDVDSLAYRCRLWSWQDNQIGYYIRHFAEARQARRTQYERLFSP